MKRYIITGAPGTGKTTLINALRVYGFTCFEEVSRRVICFQQQNQGDKTPWQDVVGFSNLVYQKTVEELNIKITQTTFVDRSLVDNIAYLKLKKQAIGAGFLNFNYKKHYHTTVFMLPPWQEIYTEDPQRLHAFEVAKELHELLLQTYIDLGFSIEILPKTTVSKRVRHIVKIYE
jgi:predicted ATPase